MDICQLHINRVHVQTVGIQRLEQERYYSGASYHLDIDDEPLVVDLSFLKDFSLPDDTAFEGDSMEGEFADTALPQQEEEVKQATRNYLLD